MRSVDELMKKVHRNDADQIIESERAGSGPSAKSTANSQKAAPFRENCPRAWNPCTSQMQLVGALAWMPLTMMLQYQALFVQSLLQTGVSVKGSSWAA